MQDHFFDIFGLPISFDVDRTVLDRAWRLVQGQSHPDCHVHAPEWQRLAALQRTMRVNEAYATLKDPIRRAIYLLSLHNIDVNALTGGISPIFLEQQMTLREAIEDALAAQALSHCEALIETLQSTCQDYRQQFSSLALTMQWLSAANVLREWLFMNKVLLELEQGMESLFQA